MTQRSRRWFYLGATLVFGLVGPILLIWAQGYRFDFRHFRILRTGGLVVTSYPENASITLDGRTRGRRSPSQLNALYPGTYRIALERRGFQTWETNVAVRAGQTHKLEATLLPADPEQAEYRFERVLTVASGPGDRLAAIVQQQGKTWLGIARPNDARWQLVAEILLPAGQQPALSWSARGSFLSITIAGHALVIVETATGQNVTPTAAAQAYEQLRWDPDNDRLLYATSTGSLWRIDLIAGVAQVVASPRVKALAVGRGELWIIRNEQPAPILQRVDPLIPNQVKLSVSLASAASLTEIVAWHRYGLVLAGATQVGLFDRQSNVIKTFSIGNLLQASTNQTESFVLLVTPTELWTVSLPEGADTLLARQSLLSDARWYPKRSAALTLANDFIRIQEIVARNAGAGELGPFPGADRLHLIGDRTMVVEGENTLTAFRLH
ncbi:MAG: PEGA domain-containing protein [Candidatus Kerfeldbacteria bacterium]|nr:PEGA domain-containing protein [Candidatus Kerfeldbacteria bacterium]